MIKTRIDTLEKRRPVDTPEYVVHWRSDDDPEPTPIPGRRLVLHWPSEKAPPITDERGIRAGE